MTQAQTEKANGAKRTDPYGQESFDHRDLIASGEGMLFRDSASRLPLPPMLMFDRISRITNKGGRYDAGLIEAVLDIRPDLWFFACHFKKDPVMPGCLGLDALWQLTGFFLAWKKQPGRGRALGVGKVRFSGMILPETRQVLYRVHMKRLFLTRGGASKRMPIAIADGEVLADGETIYRAEDLRAGLIQEMPAKSPNAAAPAPAAPAAKEGEGA